MDSSTIVDVDPRRIDIVTPRDHPDPRGQADLNRLFFLTTRMDTEQLTRGLRLPAARAYVRANRLNRLAFGAERPRFGIVASGKAFADLLQTFELIGVSEARAKQIGLAVFKVAMPWPLEEETLGGFARGVRRLLVVENKRPLIEPQIKEFLYHWRADERPEVWGKHTPEGEELLRSTRELGPEQLGTALLRFLPEGLLGEEAAAAIDNLARRKAFAYERATSALRSPFFCSGCPHNASTRAPEGARMHAGIGCHVMTELAGRNTDGFAQMGGEGITWLGQFPFTDTAHSFANLGDGTYFHSGILAIRAALAAKAPITYKILYNDAVAMTGGQSVEGTLTVPQLAHQLAAEGVERVVVLSETPERWHGRGLFPAGVPVRDRSELMGVQEELAAFRGVSVIIYDQTCAAEKRRRRKRGTYPKAERRIFINDRVCEACGDCSVQSNCISVEPLATAFGTKRAINQSACNADYSCTKGFCPSFVSIVGGEPRRAAKADIDVEALAARLEEPEVGFLAEPQNMLFTGIGGMGVTTSAAVLAMAAHIDGKETVTLDMTGLAQKNGPVTSHIRFAPRGRPIRGARVPAGELDVLLGSDLVVAAGAEVLAMCDAERTHVVVNTRVAPTAEFTTAQTQSFDPRDGLAVLGETSRDVATADFARLAERLLGDTLYANMMLIGFAFQKGLIPLTRASIEKAVHLNGVARQANLRAFTAGRIAAAIPDALTLPKRDVAPEDQPLDERIAFLARELAAYQNRRYAQAFQEAVAEVQTADARFGDKLALTRTFAEQLFKLMAYKDEYEVARLYAMPEFRDKLRAAFEGKVKLSVELAPPLLARRDPATGRPRKMSFGAWVFPLFSLLARMKGLRGTPFDPFGHTAERRAERQLVRDYRNMVRGLLAGLTPATYELAAEIAAAADLVRGYGPIKQANMERYRQRRDDLLGQWHAGGDGGEARPRFLQAAE
jgi:indolepyruvate ferredoxin oxidoreductase